MSDNLSELSLFSGCGGGLYGSKLLGWKTIGYVEWDTYCQQIIAARIKDGIFDYAPIFTDIRTFAIEYAAKYRGLVDVITAGFPCQPFSEAGHQRADTDERNLWPDTIDVIKKVQPKWCLLENVPGLLRKHGYFGTVLKDLSEAGYNAKWCCLSAQNVGAPHKRERLWIFAFPNTNNCWLEWGKQLKKSSEIKERMDWWTTEPNVDRVVDGMANRSNRLKALGNGQVPAVVREAWNHLRGKR